jgi:redox-sensitive bicupin YhaK (pirin superfamily)
MAHVHRSVRRVVKAQLQPGGTPDHTVRLVLEPGHWSEHDPFLLLAEDWFVPGTFPDHPHRGIETVTFVLEGELEHRDNRGGQGVLGPGDAQWMTAGSGLIHREEPRGRVHTLQLWLNLPASAKMSAPRYQDLRGADMPTRIGDGFVVRVFSGASGNAVATTLNHVPVTMVEIVLESQALVSQELTGGDNAFLYVLSGSGEVGPDATPVAAGDVVWLSPSDADADVTVRAATELRALLWAGPPLREPVVARGPFVMNTAELIAEAYADFRAGRF